MNTSHMENAFEYEFETTLFFGYGVVFLFTWNISQVNSSALLFLASFCLFWGFLRGGTPYKKYEKYQLYNNNSNGSNNNNNIIQ